MRRPGHELWGSNAHANNTRSIELKVINTMTGNAGILAQATVRSSPNSVVQKIQVMSNTITCFTDPVFTLQDTAAR